MKIIFFLFISISIFSQDVILLLGGINRPNAEYMEKIKEALSKEGRKIIDDIKIDTFNHTITQQAEDVYQGLKDKGITSNDRIIIIGHSQGGLRGYELYRNYKDKLNIKALFTISTPWRGASILEKIDEIIERMEGIHRILDGFGTERSIIRERIKANFKLSDEVYNKYISKLCDLIGMLNNIKNGVGSFSMKQNSAFINSLNNNENVPIFNIIGTRMSIHDIIPQEEFEDAKKALNEGKKEIIKNYELINAGVGAGFPVAMTTLFTIFGGPLGFLLGGSLSIATGITTTATLTIPRRDGAVRDLSYLISCLDFIKDFNVNSNNPNESDLILSEEEQSLPSLIKQSFVLAEHYQKYGDQQFKFHNALHDILPIEDKGKMEEIENKLIYNKEETLNILNKKISILLKKEE